MPREYGTDGDDAIRPLEPRRLAPRAAERARRLAVPRDPVAMSTDLAVQLGPLERLRDRTESGPAAELHFSIGGEIGYAHVPVPLIQRLLLDADIRLPADRMDIELVAMLLESVLAERIEMLEGALGAEISLLRMEKPTRRSGYADLAALVSTRADDEAFPVLINASAPLLARIVRLWEGRPVMPAGGTEAGFVLASRVGLIDLSTSALRALGVGDAMLFDRVAVAGGAAVMLGEHLWAPGGFREDGTLGLNAALSRTANLHLGDFAMTDGDESAPERAVSDTEIDDLPVRLLFEVGRKELSLAELRELSVGATLPLERALTSAVDIYANGRRIGAAEMVMIGDQLGVRVTRLSGAQ